MLDRITPLVLTLNEEANLPRQLASLAWARRVVIVDSHSTDRTREIAAGFPNTAFYVRRFDGVARQWNFGLTETGIDTEWVLALDADYGVTAEFTEELRRLQPAADTGGYGARFVYCIDGVPLRGALYPPVTVLLRRASASFFQDGHTHRAHVAGVVVPLSSPLRHDDRKPLSRWFASQVTYMRQEADLLLDAPRETLSVQDRIRQLVVVAPLLVFAYCLLARGGVLDGRRGLLYALQRAVAEVILSAYLVEGAVNRRTGRR